MKAMAFGNAIAVVALLCSHSQAAKISFGSNANSSISIYLDGETLNGNFDYVKFRARPIGSSLFLNPNTGLTAGVPRPSGQAFTYRNRALDFDPADPDNPGIGKGWSVFDSVTTASEVSFEGGPLGAKISTAGEPGGRLFLANLVISRPVGFNFSYINIRVYNEGAVVFAYDMVPEPSSLLLSGVMLSVAVLVARRSPRVAARLLGHPSAVDRAASCSS